jgi:hypothetical protein
MTRLHNLDGSFFGKVLLKKLYKRGNNASQILPLRIIVWYDKRQIFEVRDVFYDDL